MLRNLQVRNYVLIDSLEISFPEGLIIITGQTGAGKSILLGALSLVLGAKGDASVIAQGADNCVVEAEFEMDPNDSSLKAILEENDIEYGSDGDLVIRRVVYSTGRSRSFVNDAPVQLPVLSSLSSKLLDIHSQHQTLMLSDKQFQLSVLDHFASNASDLSECSSIWTELQKTKSSLQEVTDRLSRLQGERDYNQAQFQQLDQAHLKEGELEELDIEQKQLANAEQIKESLSSIENLFDPQDSEMPSISVSLKEIEKTLAKVSRYIPSMQELSERVQSARLDLEDVEGEVSSMNNSTDISEERLLQVEQRMTLLYDLLKKHSCRTISELIEVREKYASSLFDTDSLDSQKAELEKKCITLQKELKSVCDKLHASRVKASKAFCETITESVRFLELDRAVFDISIEPADFSKSGSDQVTFLFSSNGTAPAPLSKCASGGELSRIMLCLKAMMAKYTAMPSLIFDEIDTGVSGSVADKMGSMICAMGADMQVFAITHLPQVAAKGNAHYLVAKEYDEVAARNVSTIKRLSQKERVMEVARMLSGAEITSAAISNAESLISQA